jgi:tetratricopeptide (TPR) repeat protein
MKKRNTIFIALLVVTIIGVYWRTLDYGLIWDDEALFQHNLLFTGDVSFSSALKMGYFSEQLGMESQDHYYRPLLTASFFLEYKLWGIHPVTLRLTNLMIFIFSLIFLFFFLKGQSGTDFFPEITTLLFALSPLNIDNIVWIVGRGDLLLLLWGVLSFLFLDLSLRKKNALFLFGSSLFYFLGLCSKETSLLLFPLFVLYEILKWKKVSVFYHSANLLITLLFFFLKNSILGIKNIRFIFYPNILQDIRAAVGTLGYYARTLVFPISYDMFVPVKKVASLAYVLTGVAALLLILFLVIRIKRDKAIAWPLALLVVFLGGHAVLIFTNVFPFQIYSRYMMLPSLAVFWILTEYLARVKEKTRLSIVLILLVLFIPSIVLNADAYKSKAAFWQRAYGSLPNDEHVLFQRAKFFYDSKDILSSEVALNRILTLNVNPSTAVLVSLLYADIKILQAHYPDVLRWMKSIEGFEEERDLFIAPQIRFYANSKTAIVKMSEGDISSAEKLLTDNIQRYSRNSDGFMGLYNFYVGFEQWDKAARLEITMKTIFPRHFASLDTRRTQEQYAALPLDKKISFFVLSRNFGRAIEEVKKMPSLDLDHRIFLAKLYYLEGREDEGRAAVAAVLASDPGNSETLNKVGNFYLTELFRAKEALECYEKSQALNPSQPALLALTSRLKTDYLDRLIEVWK